VLVTELYTDFTTRLQVSQQQVGDPSQVLHLSIAGVFLVQDVIFF
jgi:hypothetical protein